MKKLLQSCWFEISLLVLLAGFTYLPRIGELGYYRDDWYFLYAALVNGPGAFIDIALHTRPIRGPLYALYYSLYGLNPLPWHITLYVTRLAGGLGALWLFNLVWPNRRQAAFFLSALFVVFPGFLWWVSGFEFQPYVLSVTLQVFSIAFTMKAIASVNSARRLAWTVAAILSGWCYLALVEYAIGMELFRLVCVYLYVRRGQPALPILQAGIQTLKTAALHLSIPVVFVFWYQFLFDNWRAAQDAGTQLGLLFSSPVTMFWRGVDMVRSLLNVTLFAWVVPFYQNVYSSRLRDLAVGLVFAGLTVVVVWLATRLVEAGSGGEEDARDSETEAVWRRELLWVGLLGTVGGVLPVVLANRVITFERVSQYSLPASLTGVIFLGGLLYSVFPRTLRWILVSAVLGMAVLAQHGLAAQTVTEERTIANFWWQVTWRVPELQVGTTLVAVYPGISYGDGDDVVWGPANFIYAPDPQGQSPVRVPITASRLEADSILEIIAGRRSFERTDLIIKNNIQTYDYKKMLILSQASETGCVRAIDPRWFELSIADPAWLYAAFQNSKIERIGTSDNVSQPPVYGFGFGEPRRGWCYYYQLASLARQRGDWKQAAQLGDEARNLDLSPNDPIEWMPFLQAYAMEGNKKQVKQISTRVNTEPFYRQQACRAFKAMPEFGFTLSPDMQAEVDDLFCK